jgi:alpha-L-fucosidase
VRYFIAAGRPIHGAGPSVFPAPPDCRYTQRGDRLYPHLFAWPFDAVHLPGLADHVVYAQLLHDGSEVKREVSDPDQQGCSTLSVGQPEGTLTVLS